AIAAAATTGNREGAASRGVDVGAEIEPPREEALA
ncbi:MAG: 30S ribosomal protein S2, partial [Sphingomonadaceae bacterium]|nr:30S ribosomal protein S2 [Sphingomonadaceae bacterium]